MDLVPVKTEAVSVQGELIPVKGNAFRLKRNPFRLQGNLVSRFRGVSRGAWEDYAGPPRPPLFTIVCSIFSNSPPAYLSNFITRHLFYP